MVIYKMILMQLKYLLPLTIKQFWNYCKKEVKLQKIQQINQKLTKLKKK